MLRLFVYGTLKRGQRNHAAYCRGLASALAARIVGRLYDLPAGYPMLAVPAEAILAYGTSDLWADAELQEGYSGTEMPRLSADLPWRLIEGELFEFADPLATLEACDALEGFEPGGTGLYDRVLVRLAEPAGLVVWTYIAPGGQLPGGAQDCGSIWPVPKT